MTILEKANAVLAEKNGKLLPENIKKDVVAFGITGTLVSLVDGSADADATATDIRTGKTAYVNGNKVEGTIAEITGDVLGVTPDITGITVDTDSVSAFSATYDENYFINSGARIGITISNTLLAEAIGLSADVIKEGVTILGITGNYAGGNVETGWENELTAITISDAIALSDTTPEVATRITLSNTSGLEDATSLVEIQNHLQDIVVAKVVSGIDSAYCVFLILDSSADVSLIVNNLAITAEGITCTTPIACATGFNVSTSGYNYGYAICEPSTEDGYTAFKTLIEDGTSTIDINLIAVE